MIVISREQAIEIAKQLGGTGYTEDKLKSISNNVILQHIAYLAKYCITIKD